MTRVTDDLVHGYLVWGRNYGEIESFSRVADRGRKWLVKLPAGATVTPSNMEPGFLEQRLVPDELMFTSREALAFGMGLAVAGARRETRTELANREWTWAPQL
jgi:hypothetical protein